MDNGDREAAAGAPTTARQGGMVCVPGAWRPAKWAAAIASAAMSLAVLFPIVEHFKARKHDSFPFSYYPMFSQTRPEVERMTYVVALEADGTRRIVPHVLYAKGGMNQARRQIAKIRRAPIERRRQFCHRVARSLAKSGVATWSTVERVQLVVGSYRLDKYFGAYEPAPEHEQVYVSCSIAAKRAKLRSKSTPPTS